MSDRPLYRYEYLTVPFADVVAALDRDAAALLQSASESAAGHAEEIRTNLVVELAGFEVGREVRVAVGALEHPDPHRARLGLQWSAARAGALFPRLEGVLEVTEVTASPPLVQLSLLATYHPPLGAVGAAGDTLWGRHVAEAALQRFLHDLMERVGTACAPGTGAGPGSTT